MKRKLQHIKNFIYTTSGFAIAVLVLFVLTTSTVSAQVSPPANNPQNGSVGVEGTIPAPPPTTGATISVPGNGQTFTTIPVTVSGICPEGLLVKLFKNNVFAGSAQCSGGSYSILIDLFSGQNDLIARVYDSLDQAGPDSSVTTVRFNDTRPGTASRVSLTTNFAKKGASPGNEIAWPIVLSGGTGPYAISVDWGDGKGQDLISRPFPGEFQITHAYESPGIYNIIVKATDKDGVAAFLQLVGVGNGALSQDVKTDGSATNGAETIRVRTKLVYWPLIVFFPFILTTFWLGKRYELQRLRRRAEQAGRNSY